jgi:beta-N-acetylhexosaminidase
VEILSLGPLMISIRGLELDQDERTWLASPVVGGVILFSRNFESLEQLERLVVSIRGLRSPELLIAVDQEGGRVQRFKAPFQALPPMRQIGHLYDSDPDAAERVADALAWIMASELRACGIDLSFAPIVDVDLGLAQVIGDRALHRSPEIVAKLSATFMAGARRAGMHATAKHFPTHAGARADSHLALAVDKRSYDELLDELAPYRALVARGLRAVMVAHVIFPALDPLPAGFSKWWIETQLRSELGFAGAVISDDISMAGAAGAGDYQARMQAALDAGCDLVLLCNEPDEVPKVLQSFATYSNPASQHRLMRLRGETAQGRLELMQSQSWRDANATLDLVRAPPRLELEG